MRIGIVGGGITGLTAACRLSQAGHQVIVFESREDLGGQAGTFPIEGTRLERFYHHLFHSDTAALSLIDELGLSDRLVWRANRGGYFYGGVIYDFVTPWDLLTFKPLPFFSRLLLGFETLWMQYTGDWRKLENYTAKEWLLRHGTQAMYDVVWGALLRSKFGSYADEVSMAWLWGKINVRRGRNRGELREHLGYLMGSFQLLIDGLADRIRSAGGEIFTSSPVERVIVDGCKATGLLVRCEGKAERVPCDAVILTVGSHTVLEMVPELPQAYAALLRKVKYQAALVMVLTLNRSVVRNYWLSLPEPEIPLVVALEHTNFIGPEHYNGKRILYLSNYLPITAPQYQMSKEELLEFYLPYIQRLNPDFDLSWVENVWLFKDPYGQPVIPPRYSQQIPSHRTPIANLYLANTTQIYPEDRGTNYAIRLGEAITRIVQGGEARASERW